MATEQPTRVNAAARIEAGHGGLPCVIVSNDLADAEIYLHGAQVTHFQPRGQAQPVLFLSTRSAFASGKSIRGGVPICFPWFGPHPTDPTLPQHGFARITSWSLRSFTRDDDSGATWIVFSLTSNEVTSTLHPFEFVANYTVTIGRTLAMSLEVRNPSSERRIQFTEALHSYLRVGDVHRATVSGLEESAYIDKTQNQKRIDAARAALQLAGETDRVYLDASGDCAIDDPVFGRKLVVQKSGSDSTVIWNPWAEKAATMKDLADDEWPEMLCVEAGNVGDAAITLAPGASHKMTATIRVE